MVSMLEIAGQNEEVHSNENTSNHSANEDTPGFEYMATFLDVGL